MTVSLTDVIVLCSQGVEFTLSEGSGDAGRMSMKLIQEELHRLIVEKKVDNEDVYVWVSVSASSLLYRVPGV